MVGVILSILLAINIGSGNFLLSISNVLLRMENSDKIKKQCKYE